MSLMNFPTFIQFKLQLIEIIKTIIPTVLATVGFFLGIKMQQRRESKKELEEIYIRNGLENQILHLTKLREHLIYNCLIYPMLFKKNGNGDYDVSHFKNNIKEMYHFIEPNIGQIRMNIFGEEFSGALESLYLVMRKQLYNLELPINGSNLEEGSALTVFEIETMLHYTIVKFTNLLNIIHIYSIGNSFKKISNLTEVKSLRKELKLFSEYCIKSLGKKNKEEIWDFLQTTGKIAKDRLNRMGLLVEAFN